MQLRHISPRSSDWMDAMDEGGGGRWWEKLAPEEREKLLRERREASGSSGQQRRGPVRAGFASGAAQGLALTSASR